MKNETPFHHFRVWRDSKGRVIGQKLSIFEYVAFYNGGDVLHSFAGKKYVVAVICSPEQNITRQDKLNFAIEVMTKGYYEISIDLATLTSAAKFIPPPP